MALFQFDPTQWQTGTQWQTNQTITSNTIVIPNLDINFGDPSWFDPSIAPSLDTMVTMPPFPPHHATTTPQPAVAQPQLDISFDPVPQPQPTYVPEPQPIYQEQPAVAQPQLDISFDPVPQPQPTYVPEPQPIYQEQPAVAKPQLDISFDPVPQPQPTYVPDSQPIYQEQVPVYETQEQSHDYANKNNDDTIYQSSQPTDYYTEEGFPQGGDNDDLDTIVSDLFVTDINDVTDTITGIRYSKSNDDDATIRITKTSTDGMIEQLIIAYMNDRYYYYLGEISDDNEIMGTEKEWSEVRTLLTDKLRLIRDIFVQESEKRHHEEQAQLQYRRQQALLNRLRSF